MRLVPSYIFVPPKAPVRQVLQIPKPLALPMMLAHRPVILFSSPALRVEGVNGVSVVTSPPVGAECRVVPQAAMPVPNNPSKVAFAALLLQVLLIAPVGDDASS